MGLLEQTGVSSGLLSLARAYCTILYNVQVPGCYHKFAQAKFSPLQEGLCVHVYAKECAFCKDAQNNV